MSAPTLSDHIDAIQIVVDVGDNHRVTGARYRCYVGRLVVADEEVPLPATTHFKACLVALRASLRALPDQTTRQVSIAVPDAAAIRLLRDPDGERPISEASAELLLEVAELLEEKLPSRRILYHLGSSKSRLPKTTAKVTVAPTIFTLKGERRCGYVLVCGGSHQSAPMRINPRWGDLEILLAILVVATRGLDQGTSVTIFTENDELLRIFRDPVPPLVSLGAAVRARHLEEHFRVGAVRADHRELVAASGERDRWVGDSQVCVA